MHTRLLTPCGHATAAAGLAPLAAAGLAPSPLAAASAAALQRRANYTSMAELPMSKAWICRGDGRFVGARPSFLAGKGPAHACLRPCDVTCTESAGQARCTGAPACVRRARRTAGLPQGMVRSEAAQAASSCAAPGVMPRMPAQVARRRARSCDSSCQAASAAPAE